MNDYDLIGMVAEATCDLCHWPYVYRDADLLHVEKCEFCQISSVIELLSERLKGGGSHDAVHEEGSG